MGKDDTMIIIVDGDHHRGIDKLAMYEEINRMAREVPLIGIVLESPGAVERAVMAAEMHIKLIKEVREIARHPRYQDRTPTSPKPRFKKGRR